MTELKYPLILLAFVAFEGFLVQMGLKYFPGFMVYFGATLFWALTMIFIFMLFCWWLGRRVYEQGN